MSLGGGFGVTALKEIGKKIGGGGGLVVGGLKGTRKIFLGNVVNFP